MITELISFGGEMPKHTCARRFVDLSHTVENGMITYPGLPGPIMSIYLTRGESQSRYAAGTEFQVNRIEMVGNTGTYLDSPFHPYANGKDLAALDLAALADLEGIVVRAAGQEARAIDATLISGRQVKGKAVLLHTGWDAHWGTEHYFTKHPFLTAEVARLLAEKGAALVGIDSLNIDDTADLTRPAHTILLSAGIPIVEHLCGLEHLAEAGFRFFAVPPKVRAFSSFPVRAFAIVDR